jgi:PAS domain S-box-containing protein
MPLPAEKTILIADDDELFREFLIDTVQEFPERFGTLVAANGNETVAAVLSHRPDVVLLDINMPGMNGYEVCRALRGNRDLPYIPIVLITGLGDDVQTRINGYEAGADDFITKPLERSELYVRLKSILRLKELRDNLQRERDMLEIKVRERVVEISETLKKFELLAQTAKEFIELPLAINIFKFICHKIKQVVADAIVITGSYQEHQESIRIEAVMGIEGLRQPLYALLRTPIEGMTFTLDPERKMRFMRGLLDVDNIIQPAITGVFGETAYAEIEKLLDIGIVYSSGFARRGKLFGMVTVVVPRGKDLERREIVDAFVNQFSVALQQRLAETSSIENEKKYRMVAETAKDIPCTIDQRGCITYIGPQVGRYGFSQQELLGRNFIECIAAEDADRMNIAFQERIIQGVDSPREYRFTAKDGNLFWIEDTVTLLRSVNGSVIGMTVVLRDITEKKAGIGPSSTSPGVGMKEKPLPLANRISDGLREIGKANSDIIHSAEILERLWRDVIAGLDMAQSQQTALLISGIPYQDVREELICLIKDILEDTRKIVISVEGLREIGVQKMSVKP